MLHGSIAAHHQEQNGRGQQCGTPFPTFPTAPPPYAGLGLETARPATRVVPLGTPLQLVASGARRLIRLADKTIGEAEDPYSAARPSFSCKRIPPRTSPESLLIATA